MGWGDFSLRDGGLRRCPLTTICWDGKTLAGDTLCTTSDDTVIYGDKIWRTPIGLFGGAGDDPAIEILLLWIQNGAKVAERPTLPEDADFTGLLIKPDRTIAVLDTQFVPVTYYPQRFAIGSGAAYAIAYMTEGFTSTEAIQRIIDRRLDPHTGGTVTSLTLDDLPS